MQEFLNPNNWSSPDIPQRIADAIAKEVEGDRTALGQGSPSVASNSRIPANDSSTTSSPRTSNNLSGENSQSSSTTSRPGGSPPVITSFTCNGHTSSCTAAWKGSVSYSISYTDEDGDASSWQVSGFTVGQPTQEGKITAANGRSGSINTSGICYCSGGGCSSSSTFPIRAVLIDATGLQATASLNLKCEPSVIERIQDVIRDRSPIRIPRLPF